MRRGDVPNRPAPRTRGGDGMSPTDAPIDLLRAAGTVTA
jgi:hypothetical protein